MKNINFFLGFVLFILAGCGSAVNEKEYPGDYVFEKAGVKNQIRVFANGTYVHSIEAKGSVTIEKSGYWDKDEFDGEKGMTFKSFQIDNTAGGGFWFVVPDRASSGEVQLCIDVEESICFKKVK